MRQPVVEIKELVKRYGSKIALDHMNLKVEEGEIFGLLGPNGCGKTTTIHCLLGFLNYTSGEIRVFGRESIQEVKKEIGFVPQELAILPSLTVYENIDFFCGLYIPEKSVRKTLVEEAIRFVELTSHRNVIAKKLSGGLKRRLNIACGIAHNPKFIIMDEPTVAVDAQSRNFILEGIRELKKRGNTVIYTTHYLEEAEEICDKIMIIDEGVPIANGSLKDLQNLIGKEHEVKIDFENISEEQIQELKTMEGVLEFRVHPEHPVHEAASVTMRMEGDSSYLKKVISMLEDRNLTFTNISSEMPSLNKIFLTLTGKELRDL